MLYLTDKICDMLGTNDFLINANIKLSNTFSFGY